MTEKCGISCGSFEFFERFICFEIPVNEVFRFRVAGEKCVKRKHYVRGVLNEATIEVGKAEETA